MLIWFGGRFCYEVRFSCTTPFERPPRTSARLAILSQISALRLHPSSRPNSHCHHPGHVDSPVKIAMLAIYTNTLTKG